MGFSYPGWAKHPRHPGPLLPVSLDQNIGFTWLQAAAGELRASCFFQARGSGLMIIKTKLWDSDKIFWADCRGFNTNSFRALWVLRSHGVGTALVKLREVCQAFSSTPFTPRLLSHVFPPFSTCPINYIFFVLCCNCNPREKKSPKDIYVTPMHPKL